MSRSGEAAVTEQMLNKHLGRIIVYVCRSGDAAVTYVSYYLDRIVAHMFSSGEAAVNYHTATKECFLTLFSSVQKR